MIIRQHEVYVVRIWLEPSGEGAAWRACATDIRSQERSFFTTPEALKVFLGLEQLPEALPLEQP